MLDMGRVNFKLCCDGGINISWAFKPDDCVGDSKLTEETAQTLKTPEHNTVQVDTDLKNERERERGNLEAI